LRAILDMKLGIRLNCFPYNDLNDLVGLCIRIEQKLQRKSRDYPKNSYSRRDSKREGDSSTSIYEGHKKRRGRDKNRKKRKRKIKYKEPSMESIRKGI